MLTLLALLACAPNNTPPGSTASDPVTAVGLDAYRASFSDQLDSPPTTLAEWTDIVDGDEISAVPGRGQLYITLYMLGPVGMGRVGYSIDTAAGETSLAYQEGSTEFEAFPDSAVLGMRAVHIETGDGTEELLGSELTFDLHIWDVEEADSEGIVYLDRIVEGGVDETFSVAAVAMDK